MLTPRTGHTNGSPWRRHGNIVPQKCPVRAPEPAPSIPKRTSSWSASWAKTPVLIERWSDRWYAVACGTCGRLVAWCGVARTRRDWAHKRLLQDFEDGFHLDGRAGGKLRETQCAPGVEAVALFAEDLVEQVGTAVDHQVLVGEIER